MKVITPIPVEVVHFGRKQNTILCKSKLNWYEFIPELSLDLIDLSDYSKIVVEIMKEMLLYKENLLSRYDQSAIQEQHLVFTHMQFEFV